MASPKPLSARSVMISLLLGAHPRGMTARELVRTGLHFGLPEASARVALTRAVAAGELLREDATYRIGARLLSRGDQLRQHAVLVPWTGGWEMAVVTAPARPNQERTALRQTLAAARLAELREGVWMRPANLDRPLPHEDSTLHGFVATPREDPAALAARLWDLTEWAREAEATLDLLAVSTEPGRRLAVAALLVRHLATDPLLPPELWPAGWPGPRARQASAAFEQEVREIVASAEPDITELQRAHHRMQ